MFNKMRSGNALALYKQDTTFTSLTRPEDNTLMSPGTSKSKGSGSRESRGSKRKANCQVTIFGITLNLSPIEIVNQQRVNRDITRVKMEKKRLEFQKTQQSFIMFQRRSANSSRESSEDTFDITRF